MASASVRRGTSLVEVLVALLLGLVLASLSMGLLARQRRVQSALMERMDLVAAVRVVRHLLGSELRGGWSAPDVILHPPDSLGLRAYRGVARVCEGLSWNRMAVATEGVRRPDVGKDSVMFLTSDGGSVPAALLSVDPYVGGRCRGIPGAPATLVVSDSIPPGVVLARFFERGSYHLSGRALRYRRGLSGRQPLTPEILRMPATAFLPRDGGGIGVLLEARRSAGPVWNLSFPGGAP